MENTILYLALVGSLISIFPDKNRIQARLQSFNSAAWCINCFVTWPQSFFFFSLNLMFSLSLDVCFRFSLIFFFLRSYFKFLILFLSLILSWFCWISLGVAWRLQPTLTYSADLKVNNCKCFSVSISWITIGWSSTSPLRSHYRFDPTDSLLVLTLKL